MLAVNIAPKLQASGTFPDGLKVNEIVSQFLVNFGDKNIDSLS